MSTKRVNVGTSKHQTQTQKTQGDTQMKQLVENIEIPEVPIPHRILIAHKKHLAALKQSLKHP
jgi:hypothetical protein